MITPLQIKQLGIPEGWDVPLNQTFIKYDINTPTRQAFFVGQAAHESNNFRALEENLHYSASGLMRTWPSRFPDLDTANKYANNPQLIANKVYSGRMGNTEDGDGWAFHGRGIFQLTGRDSYDRCGKALGVDLISKPQLLVEPNYACLSAGWFWNKAGLNALADAQDTDTMTKRINGGLLGLDDRKARIAKAISVLG